MQQTTLTRLVAGALPGDATLTIRYPGGPTAVVPVHVTPVATKIALAVATGPGTSRAVATGGEPLTVGASQTLIATARDVNDVVLNEPLTFSTTQPSIVDVTASGANSATVRALSVGSATVTVTSSSDSRVKSSATFIVTAVPTGGPATRIAITSTPASATASVASSVQFTASPKDANGNTASGCPINWAIDETNIANITATGLATGKAAGLTAVRAFCADHSDLAAAAKLTITDAAYGVSQVNIGPTHYVYAATAQSVQVTSVVTQSAPGASAPVNWSLLPTTSAASIDATGKLTIPVAALSPGGGVTVTATAAGQTDIAWVSFGNVGTITGTVVSATGQYLGGTTATATPTGGGASVITTVKAQGVFYIVGLAPGSYNVTIRQQGNPVPQTVSNVSVTVGTLTTVSLTPFPSLR